MVVGIVSGVTLFLIAALMYRRMSENVVAPIKEAHSQDNHEQNKKQPSSFKVVPLIAVAILGLLTIIGYIIYKEKCESAHHQKLAVDEPNLSSNDLNLPNSFTLKELHTDGKTFVDNPDNIFKHADCRKTRFLLELLRRSETTKPQDGKASFHISPINASLEPLTLNLQKSPLFFDIYANLKSNENTCIPLPQSDSTYVKDNCIEVACDFKNVSSKNCIKLSLIFRAFSTENS